MGTGITDVIGGPHDFLPLRSDRFDEFKKNLSLLLLVDFEEAFDYIWVILERCTEKFQA
jgi:hypothetical protein